MVGSVAELWRYPVKSMRGERVEALEVTPRGASGDRAWALRDLADGKVASCKRHPALLGFRAAHAGDDGSVEIEAPDGRTFGPGEPGASAIVSEILGHPMRFERDPGPAELAGIDRATVFAGVPIEDMNVEFDHLGRLRVRRRRRSRDGRGGPVVGPRGAAGRGAARRAAPGRRRPDAGR